MSRSDRLALAFASGAFALPPAGTILVLNAEPSAIFEALGPARFLAEQGFRPLHDALAARGIRVVPHADAPAAMVVVNLVRARAATMGLVARGLRALPPGCLLVVNGNKTDGIDSLRRVLDPALPLVDSFAKAHGKVLGFRRPADLPRAIDTWEVEAAPRRNAAGFVTAPGMFSHDGADPGSQRLAAEFGRMRLAGRVADLGAGWGWLAAQALAAAPAIERIELFEADHAALAAARENVIDPRASFQWADVARLGAGDGPFDLVLSNPPFHQQRSADPALGAGFVAAAARLLKPMGRLLMVANRQLPYESHLRAQFREVEKLQEDRFFKVLAAARPTRR